MNLDSSIICALSDDWMNYESPSPYCGTFILVTNIGSNDYVGGAGNQIIVAVEDTCTSCNKTHVDFSVGAWNKLTNSALYGTIKIQWYASCFNGLSIVN